MALSNVYTRDVYHVKCKASHEEDTQQTAVFRVELRFRILVLPYRSSVPLSSKNCKLSVISQELHKYNMLCCLKNQLLLIAIRIKLNLNSSYCARMFQASLSHYYCKIRILRECDVSAFTSNTFIYLDHEQYTETYLQRKNLSVIQFPF